MESSYFILKLSFLIELSRIYEIIEKILIALNLLSYFSNPKTT